MGLCFVANNHYYFFVKVSFFAYFCQSKRTGCVTKIGFSMSDSIFIIFMGFIKNSKHSPQIKGLLNHMKV